MIKFIFNSLIQCSIEHRKFLHFRRNYEKNRFRKFIGIKRFVGWGFFVGADVGNSKVTVDYSEAISSEVYNDSISGSGSDSDGMIGMKVGYYLNDNNRIYANLQKVNVEDSSMYNYGLSYDYLIGSGALKPFIGVGIGATSLKIDEGFDNGRDVNINGMTYSARLGVNYKINKNFEAEASFQYSKMSGDDSATETFSIYSTPYTITEKIELDKATTFQIGLNYRF